MIRRILPLFLIPTLFSCGGSFDQRVALDPAAAGVELVTAQPQGCRALGDVLGTASAEGDQAAAMQDARNDVRNKARALGATHVVLQTNNADRKMGMWRARVEVTLGGTAYQCTGSAQEPAPPSDDKNAPDAQ